jgi:hypoxanthine-DNA glycosylase
LATTPETIHGFPPISAADARVLILGSMPSAASLAEEAYYAHPRNAFWPIMARLLGFPPGAPYTERAAALREHGIALWDVLHSCVRPGSLDSRIEPASMAPNDFTAFFRDHPAIEWIAFNGATAEASYCKRVRPGLVAPWHDLPSVRLPSTSPANARLRFEEKLAAWRVLTQAPG